MFLTERFRKAIKLFVWSQEVFREKYRIINKKTNSPVNLCLYPESKPEVSYQLRCVILPERGPDLAFIPADQFLARE